MTPSFIKGLRLEAIRAVITSEQVRDLPEYLGSVDQYVDSTDALNDPKRFKAMYAPGPQERT